MSDPEARLFIQNPGNKLAVTRSLAKGLRLQKVEETVEGYEVMRTLYERRIHPNVTGIRNVIRLLAPTNEKVARLRAEDVVDDRPSLFSTETRPYFSRRSAQSLRRSLHELIHGRHKQVRRV